MSPTIENELQQRILHPHLRVEEAFPFLLIFKLKLLDLGGGHSVTGLCINDLLPLLSSDSESKHASNLEALSPQVTEGRDDG